MKLNNIISLFIINVMINDTIKKYEIKETHKIYVETLLEKKLRTEEKASLSI